MAAAPAIDPATGLPVATAAPAASTEQVDVGSFIVKIPSLTDARLADVLDAIVLVCDHPVKYSIQDFAVVFSAKGPETPQLFSRTYKVDPNTFYSGLESVSAQSFGGSDNSSGGGGGGGGSSRGGGGGGGGGNGQNNGGAVVGVVNAFSGAGSLRNTGNGGGGGGGGGGGNQGSSASLLNPNAGGGAGGGGGQNGGGGLAYITQQTSAVTPSQLVVQFFNALGVNLSMPGKAVFFNDRLGKLFVKATEQDLDTIERAIEALNEVAPQVHIKARFIEVAQRDSKALGFDWYLGQFNVSGGGSVVGTGGSAPSANVPVSAANPLGLFPGNTAANVIPGSAGDSLVTGGLRNAGPSIFSLTGILTDPNFRLVIKALEQRSGTEFLAEPEVTTISGRQTQMRATDIKYIVTGVGFEQGQAATTTTGTGN
jgi:type II secretory pathway component GspD/PulD (secretin)